MSRGKLLGINRRQFIQLSGATMVVATAGGGIKLAKAFELKYPVKKVANISQLKDNEAITFNYPDNSSPAVLIKLGEKAIGGVGPKRDIVAFSAICTHMGCPVQYKGGRLLCSCHYSMFDPAKAGQTYQGLASSWLPQILLRVDKDNNIYAVAMSGTIWGRVRNVT